MPKYIPAGEYKEFSGRIFKPTDSDYMNKNSVVGKVVKQIYGEHRRNQLEKAFSKLNVDEVIMLGMLFEKAIEKEIEARKDH